MMGILEKRWFVLLLWIYITISLIGDLINKDYPSIYKMIFFIAVIYTLYLSSYFLFFNKGTETQLKIIKIIQVIGFGSLFLIVVVPFRYLENRFFFLFFLSVTFILLSVFLRRSIKVEIKANSLEEKIRADFKITSKTIRKKFPDTLSGIGGFVLPYFPFFSVLNKNWKKRLDKEALIHENVHLYYLQNGIILLFIFFGLFFFKLTSFITENTIFPAVVYSVLALTFFEYITFKKTNRYADKLGIKTRKWNKGIMLTYLIIYSIQITIFVGVYLLIKSLF